MERVYRGYAHPSAYKMCMNLYGGYAQNIKSKEGKEWCSEYQSLYSALCHMDSELITVREEAKRLRYENEFMLKLIQEKQDGL